MQERKIVTVLLLQEKAAQFWAKMDIYKDMEVPKCSERWLSRWIAF